MQKQNRILFVAFLVIIQSFLLDCKSRQPELIGFWENDKKIIEFGENYFAIYNKDNSNVIAFKGIFSFADNPSYAIKMNYLEYLSPNGNWNSLKGTELEDYTDTLLFKIENNILETRVLGNNQRYQYKRINSPATIGKQNSIEYSVTK